MNRPKYYKRDGTPYEGDGLMAWARDFDDPEPKRVANTTLPNGRNVSTVWLGADHQFGGGPPLIFETMVFSSKDDDPADNDMDRYSTEEQAVEGHKRMVEKWK